MCQYASLGHRARLSHRQLSRLMVTQPRGRPGGLGGGRQLGSPLTGGDSSGVFEVGLSVWIEVLLERVDEVLVQRES